MLEDSSDKVDVSLSIIVKHFDSNVYKQNDFKDNAVRILVFFVLTGPALIHEVDVIEIDIVKR